MRKRSPQNLHERRPRPDDRRDSHAPRHRPSGGDAVLLYGWHPVAAALANPARRVRRLLATENAAHRLKEELPALTVAAEIVRPEQIAAMLTPDAVHQGLLLICDPLPEPSLEDLAEGSLVLVLDQVTDPHNVGAILRTATAFGVAAIVTTGRNAPEATGVLAKSASGGLEHTPIIQVGNLARALDQLGRRGFHRVGLDSDGPTDLAVVDLRGSIALVLGAEGSGLRRLTRENCDALARLDLPGAIRSLNVSNAAAVALYVAMRARS
jgi:23S rRNA (guanosine2251-2'-O)-methyltransferase